MAWRGEICTCVGNASSRVIYESLGGGSVYAKQVGDSFVCSNSCSVHLNARQESRLNLELSRASPNFLC